VGGWGGRGGGTLHTHAPNTHTRPPYLQQANPKLGEMARRVFVGRRYKSRRAVAGRVSKTLRGHAPSLSQTRPLYF